MQVYDGFADAKMKAERAEKETEKETGKTMNNRKLFPRKIRGGRKTVLPCNPEKNISYLANFSQFL